MVAALDVGGLNGQTNLYTSNDLARTLIDG